MEGYTIVIVSDLGGPLAAVDHQTKTVFVEQQNNQSDTEIVIKGLESLFDMPCTIDCTD